MRFFRTFIIAFCQKFIKLYFFDKFMKLFLYII